MGLDQKQVLEDIDSVISEVDGYLATLGTAGSITREAAHAFMLAAAAIRRYAPVGSEYMTRTNQLAAVAPADAARVAGFLHALRRDYARGMMSSVAELLHADTFADYLSQASHLLNEGYKVAAAVIAGSTLEAHLRALAANVGVDVNQGDGKPKKAIVVTADLYKASAITKGDDKQIVAWLDLRNDAAHGHPDKFEDSQVGLFIEGLRDFMRRVPA